MPFDDTNYRAPEVSPPAPTPRPRMTKREELFLLVMISMLAVLGLLLPISASALVDLAHLVQRRS